MSGTISPKVRNNRSLIVMLLSGMTLVSILQVNCKPTVIRDAQTYKNELAWSEATSLRLAQLLTRMLKR
jgi:hypothetical protein